MQKTHIRHENINLPEDFPVSSPGFITPPEYAHLHNCFEIGCCYSGTGGVFQIGAKIYSCNPGDMVFISEQEYHLLNEATPENSSWKFINLDPPALLSGYLPPEENVFETSSFSGAGFKNVISSAEDPELAGLVHSLFRETENQKSFSRSYIRAVVWAIFVKLRQMTGKSPKHHVPRNAGDFCRLYPALSYISRSYKKTLDIPELASMCSMGVTAFRKHFHRHTGLLPLQYINSYRLKIAASMLKNSNIQIMDIALATGFPTLSHFNRTFKKEYSCSPREFRNGSVS